MEDREAEQLLRENLELTEENNRILRKMLRAARWGLVFSSLKWLIIIGSAIGLYYFFQPLLEGLVNTYNAIPGVADLNFFQNQDQ